MRIVFVVHTLDAKDGWSRYASDIARALHERGHDIHALVAKEVEPQAWCTQHQCLRSPVQSLHPLVTLLQWWRVFHILKRVRPDVVHVVCEPYIPLCGLVPGAHRLIATIHGTYAVIPFRSGFLTRLLAQNGFRLAHAVISVSSFTANYLLKEENAFARRIRLSSKLHIISNAVRLDPPALRIDKKDPVRTRSIIGVGAVKHRKGYIQAVRALAAYRKKTSQPFIFNIIGATYEKEYVSLLEREIRDLKMEDCVRIRGIVSETELQTAYKNADLFLLLSLAEQGYFEGFVLGFLEAAARGVPCIGPTTGGCPEAISEGVSGYVRNPYDAEKVADAISDVLDQGKIDPAACRAWAERHDIKLAAEKIEAVYMG